MGGIAVAAGLLWCSAAQAAGGAVSATPFGSLQTNGTVYAIAVSGATAYIGGSFSEVRPAGTGAGASGEVARKNLAAVSLTTGKVLAWEGAANAPVRAIAVSSTGVYIGGDFTASDGIAANYLAELNRTTGARVTAFGGRANAQVAALELDGSTLFMGGQFTASDHTDRNHLSAVNATTGKLVPGWVASTNSEVRAMTMSADGSKLIIGGQFTAVDTKSQVSIAAISPASGALITWGGSSSTLPVIALAADGSGVYAGTGGAGGTLQAFDPSTGALMWEDGANGDVQAVAVAGGMVYAGGHFKSYCGPGPGAETCPGSSVARLKLFAVDEPTGASLQSWAPNPNSVLGVYALTYGDSTLTAGGAFTKVAGRAQQGFAMFRG
jgi:outer membrane protein assembly factor BamB